MKKIKPYYHNLLLLLILLFSVIIKIWQLDTNPAGFFCDEAQIGYDAYNIWQKGTDRYGNKFPIFFTGFNSDNISPYLVYFTVPFVGLFGLNEIAVRGAAVFWSIIALFLFYLLLKELINEKIALLGTFILSISPWHFYLSRINFGDYYAWSGFTLLSYFFLIKGLKSKKIIHLLTSSVFFGLTTYSYYPARMLTPIIFGLSIILMFSKKIFKNSLLMILVYLIVIIPFLLFHLNSNNNPFQRLKDTTSISFSKTNQIKIIDKSFINKVWKKYLTHFQNDFLFEKGDSDFPGQFIRRHSIAGLGLLYPYQKWLIIAGLIWLLYKIFFKKKTELLFVIFLLLLFPVADSLTLDKTPFATRSYLGVLPFHILIAFGVYAIYQILNLLKLWKYLIVKTLAISLLAFFIITSFITLMTKFSDNPLTTSDYWGWQYGPRDIIHYFTSVESEYDELIMEPKFNDPSIFFKFYAPNNCQKCLLGDLTLFDPSRKQLFALSNEYFKDNPSLSYKIKKIIYYPNGETAFKIIEIL